MMFDLSIVQSLGTMIILSSLLVLLLRNFKIPNLVAYILAGLLVTPFTNFVVLLLPGEYVRSDLANLSIIKTISEVGIALLLFLVGLELSLEKVKNDGKVALIAGFVQIIFTAIGAFCISTVLGFDTLESIFIAIGLTFSSTVVVVKLLDHKKEIDSLYGRISVGIFLVQDLVVILVLTVLGSLSPDEVPADSMQIYLSLIRALASMFGLLLLSLAASRWFLSPLFNWSAHRSSELLFFMALLWCFAFVLLAEMLHLSVEVGAFLAGLSLAQLHCSEDLHRRVKPIMNFFIGIFFVSLGAQMELAAAKEFLPEAIILSIFVLFGKSFMFIWIISRLGYSARTAFLTSVTVAQISEFSFIFAALGLSKGYIDSAVFSLIAVVGLITIATSSYMILYNHEIYDFVSQRGFLRWIRKETISEETDEVEFEHHIIIIGQNSLGRELSERLHAAGECVLSIDTDILKLRNLPSKTMLGNVAYLSVLEEANYQKAKLVISTLTIEDVNLLLAYRCRQHEIPVAIHAFDSGIISDLNSLNVDLIINSKKISSDEIDRMMHQGAMLP